MKYENQMEAHKATNVNYSSIGATCRGIQKTAGGFIWKYEGDGK